MPPDLALLSIRSGWNYPCLELIFMVPKVFEPLRFDSILQVTELEKVQKDHEQTTQSLETTQKTAEDTRLTLVQLQQEHSTVILLLQLFYSFMGNCQIQ